MKPSKIYKAKNYAMGFSLNLNKKIFKVTKTWYITASDIKNAIEIAKNLNETPDEVKYTEKRDI